MHRKPHEKIQLIDGPAGSLEGLLELPAGGEPNGSAVICHPHPLHGGTLLNKVVHTLYRAFSRSQFVSLRFNFRGVGKSTGDFDDGRGEVQDVLAAVKFMQHKYANLPLWLAGFSFGGAMAVQATATANASGLVCVAPATSRFARDGYTNPGCPWLIVQGDKDELVDINETIEYINNVDPGPELVVFSDGEHFFHGRLIELRDTVEHFIRTNL